jgi:hypothetical protein
MTTELKATLAEHAAGNYRVMMNLGDELLTIAAERELLLHYGLDFCPGFWAWLRNAGAAKHVFSIEKTCVTTAARRSAAQNHSSRTGSVCT